MMDKIHGSAKFTIVAGSSLTPGLAYSALDVLLDKHAAPHIAFY